MFLILCWDTIIIPQGQYLVGTQLLSHKDNTWLGHNYYPTRIILGWDTIIIPQGLKLGWDTIIIPQG